MKVRTKKLWMRLPMVLLIATLGLTATTLCVRRYFRTGHALNTLTGSDTFQDQEMSLPDGWGRVEIKSEVAMLLPQDMKPSKLIGDSPAYREAYSNRVINITIVYGEAIPLRRNQSDSRFDQCDTPRFLLDEPTYRESVIDIGGRKAKLGINRYHQPDYIIADVCFPKADENTTPLRVIADCRGEPGLVVAQQIFASIKFIALGRN